LQKKNLADAQQRVFFFLILVATLRFSFSFPADIAKSGEAAVSRAISGCCDAEC
jgi:hypothetical protein